MADHINPRWRRNLHIVDLGNFISDSEISDGSFIFRGTQSVIPRDQKITQLRHMAAQSHGFHTVCKRKRPAPSLVVLRLRCCSSKFLLARQLCTGRSKYGEGGDFFYLHRSFKSVIVILPINLTHRFRFEVFLTAE